VNWSQVVDHLGHGVVLINRISHFPISDPACLWTEEGVFGSGFCLTDALSASTWTLITFRYMQTCFVENFYLVAGRVQKKQWLNPRVELVLPDLLIVS